jgi:hypothetical protein
LSRFERRRQSRSPIAWVIAIIYRQKKFPILGV